MKRELRLTIADECLAAWVSTNNAFAAKDLGGDWDTGTHYWNGVLIQIGHNMLIKQHEDAGRKTAKPHAVYLIRPDKSILREISAADIDKHKIWINAVPVLNSGLPGLKGPVLPKHGAKLFPEGGNGKPEPLHPCFVPLHGGITIWQDWRADGGFTLEARQDANGGNHNKYRFTFHTEVTLPTDRGLPTMQGFKVEVFGHPFDPAGDDRPYRCYPSADRRSVDPGDVVSEILISGPPDLPSHGDGQNPPEKP